MATAESVKSKIQGLIDTANKATGGVDADLTSAVNTLVAGFESGGGGAILLESGTITIDEGTTYFIQELSETPDLLLIWTEELTGSCTAGCIIANLPIDILPTDTAPAGAVSNVIVSIRYNGSTISNAGEISQTAIYISDGIPYFRMGRLSSSYPLVVGDYHFETYRMWS